MRKTPSTILYLGLGLALSLPACSDDGNGGANGNGDANGASNGAPNGDSGTGGGAAECNLDFSRLEGADPVSFKDDVMPIFGLSCNSSACHDKESPQAQMFLGPRCSFDSDTQECRFNQEGEPPLPGLEGNETRGTPPEDPLTDEVLSMVHGNITGVASTEAPSVNRVEPGAPGDSFLIYKTASVQEDQGLDCMTPGGLPGCGDPMPPQGDALCLSSQERFDVIATWILQGAPNN